MAGHIGLGATAGTLREYALTDIFRYQVANANPFAAKLDTGGGDYSALDTYAAWVQEEWQGGVGRTKPDAGGFLFGEMETRVPNQFILPGATTFFHAAPGTPAAGQEAVHNPRQAYGNAYAVQAVGGAGNPATVACKVGVGVDNVWFLARIPAGTQVTFYINADSGGSPGALLASKSITLAESYPGFQWVSPYAADEAHTGVASAGPLWVCIAPEAGKTLELMCATARSGGATLGYSGGAWGALASRFPFYLTEQTNIVFAPASPFPYVLVRSGAFMYGIAFSGVRHKWNPATTTSYATVAELLREATLNLLGAPVEWNGAVWVPGVGGSLKWTGGTVTPDVAADLLCAWKGYLVRSVGENLYYSGDGTTWEGPFQFCAAADDITSIAGMGDNFYVATPDGLFYLAPGDYVAMATTWPRGDGRNGRSMVHHQGALYMIVNNRVVQYSEGGGMMDVWVSRDDDLPATMLGTLHRLVSMNNWLLAVCHSTAATGARSSVWAWNGEGWHHIATGPLGARIGDVFYDSVAGYLVMTLTTGVTGSPLLMQVYLPDFALNPYNDGLARYMAVGWLETPWYYGGLREIDKDVESVYVTGEGFSASVYLEVYWKDDASTGWERLGTVTQNRQELRWTDPATRPATKQIKLGLLARTAHPAYTPKVQAVRVKYHNNVTDKRRWQLPVLVSPGTQFPDGTVQARSVAQQVADLTALVKQTPPVVLRDVDGAVYDVKVEAWSRGVVGYRMNADGSKAIDYVYNLTLLELNQQS